ncbi:MAG: transposase [Deltaproteobacteria bacterium]|nr:transposase [Deltaproteobacteria bacterium]
MSASQSVLSRLENDVLGNAEGLKALDEAILRSADALIKKKWKYRFILYVDSTDDQTYGKQEGCEYNGHFREEFFHPIFAFTGECDALAGYHGRANVENRIKEGKNTLRWDKTSCHYWWVHVASAFPLRYHYQAVLDYG